MSQVLDALIAHARSRPDAVALSDHRRALTYPELLAQVELAMEALRAAAPANVAGAPVAVRLENGPAWVVLDLALAGLGWPSLPIPGFFAESQTAHAIADCGAGLSVGRGGEGFVLEICGEPLRLAVLAPSLATLPEDQRACVTLCLGQAWSHAEAADALGLPLGTVKSHVTRGRERLLAVMGGSR